jgi:hypothetical protein
MDEVLIAILPVNVVVVVLANGSVADDIASLLVIFTVVSMGLRNISFVGACVLLTGSIFGNSVVVGPIVHISI